MPDLLEQIQTKKEARNKREKSRQEKLDKADAILGVCLDSDRNPNADETKSIKGFKSEATEDANFIALLDSSIEELEARAASAAEAAAEFSNRQTDPDTTKVRVGKDRVMDDPKKGYKHPRELLNDVMAFYRSERTIMSERLKPLRVKPETRAVGSDEQSTFSDPYGGFLVPTAFSPELMKLDPEADPMGAFTTRIPMQTPSVVVPYRVDKDHTDSVSGGLTVSRKEESKAATASRMEVGQLKLDANSLFGLAYATEEILTDSPISFAALLAAGFSDEFASAIIDERINGTGSGEMQGALVTPCKIEIAAENGQSEGIVLQNILKMMARCWRFGNAIWLANQTCIPWLATLNQAVGTGGQVMWFQNAQDNIPARLMGRPLVFTEYCKALNTTGDLILANWSQYIEGIYQPLQSAESIHVRFVNHERTFKFWLRNAGHWWWDAELTPKNGDTLSPVVTLATRS